MTLVAPINPIGNIARPIGGTDLGMPFKAFGKVGLVFGDTFGKQDNGALIPAVGGQDWRSPVIVWSEPLGSSTERIRVTDAIKGGAQLWDYPHNNPVFSTVLPTDAIEIDGRIYVWVMVTKGLGNEVWCELAYTDDRGATWANDGTKWSTTAFGGKRVMLTFDRKPGSDIIDIFSTGGLKRDKSVLRWRVHKDHFLNYREWEGWCFRNGRWGWVKDPNGSPNTPGEWPSDILPGWKVGEIGFRYIENNAVLSGFDSGDYSIFVKVGANTDANWVTAPTYRPVTGNPRGVDTLPQLYGGYVHPDSRFSDGLTLIVSNWNTARGNPYQASQYRVTGIKPVVSTAPQPIATPIPPSTPKPEPTPTPDDQEDDMSMTVEEALDVIARQLAASSSIALMVDGKKTTLRGAVERILWKANTPLRLDGRPIAPKTADDQFGQVLSARAEGLVTQALVAEIAKKQGVDVAAVRKSVLEGLR